MGVFLKVRIFFFLFFFAFPFLFHEIRHPFRPGKLSLKLKSRAEWAPQGNINDETFKHPFFYLGKGSQSFVFESLDHNTVLKLFRYNRSRFPIIHALKTLFRKKSKAHLVQKIEKTFGAYLLALNVVPDCTGVFYLHLNATEDPLPIELVNEGGKIYKLDLNRYRFALQRKAKPLKETLMKTIQEGDQKKAEELIHSFYALLEKRVSLGIQNTDPNLGTNFGFIDDKAVEIDCGNYRFASELFDPLLKEREIQRFRVPFEAWLPLKP